MQAESTLTRVKIETIDGRVLYLTAQISSGNFALRGIKEIELPVADFFEQNPEEASVVVSGNQPVAESSVAVSGNPVNEVPSGFVQPGTVPARKPPMRRVLMRAGLHRPRSVSPLRLLAAFSNNTEARLQRRFLRVVTPNYAGWGYSFRRIVFKGKV